MTHTQTWYYNIVYFLSTDPNYKFNIRPWKWQLNENKYKNCIMNIKLKKYNVSR